MGPIVIIASSIANVRRRGRQALQGRFAIREVAHRAALVRSMARFKPDFLLLDVDLPRLGGVGSLPDIQRLSPQTAIVVLTSALDEKEGVSALKAGVRGYCDKDIAPSTLKKAVERIQEGEIWVGRKIVSNFLDELASIAARRQRHAVAKLGSRFECLSFRQREIAHLVGGGASNREIANRLNVSEKTVKAYLTAVFRKLGLSNRLQLALFVAEHARGSN